MLSYPLLAYRVPQLVRAVDLLRTCSFEHCLSLALDTNDTVVSQTTFSSSGSQEVVINSRKLFQSCLYENAVQLILLHNHPSGFSYPSAVDLATTDRLSYILDSFGVFFTDHIIVTKQSYFSFSEAGMISSSKNQIV